MFIQLTAKEPDGKESKILVNSGEIAVVVDTTDGVVVKLKDESQANVTESYLTVKNRIKETHGVI